MKTSDLIAFLAAAAAQPAPPGPALARLAPGLLAGGLIALAILAVWLGVQPLNAAMHASWFWMKAFYCLAIAASGLALLARLARPGATLGVWALGALAVALAAIAGMAARQLMLSPIALRPSLWMGGTWRVCPWRILALSLPIYAGLVLALRRLAPTRPLLAGAAAGLTAGGAAGLVYGFYCQEHAAPFVAVWYTAGITACAAMGAISGARLLRW
jgi:hypothetical protein